MAFVKLISLFAVGAAAYHVDVMSFADITVCDLMYAVAGSREIRIVTAAYQNDIVCHVNPSFPP
jgi:hypothetical protein